MIVQDTAVNDEIRRDDKLNRVVATLNQNNANIKSFNVQTDNEPIRDKTLTPNEAKVNCVTPSDIFIVKAFQSSIWRLACAFPFH